nr:actin-related protein 7 [Tanacetum cinerariifolium]
MACPLPHTYDEIQALVTKLIDEDIIRQKSLIELAVQFENASAAKSDFRKAYEKCYDITRKPMAVSFLAYHNGSDYHILKQRLMVSNFELFRIRHSGILVKKLSYEQRIVDQLAESFKRDVFEIIPTQMKIINDDGSILDSPSLLANNVDPVVRGFVKDWDAMEDLLHHVMYNGLGWEIGVAGLLADHVNLSNHVKLCRSSWIDNTDSKDISLRRMVYLRIKELSSASDEAEEPEEVKIMLRLEMMFS